MNNEENTSSATKIGNPLTPWYLATMNDGLFVTNRRPRPAPVDYVNPNLESPEIVIPLPGNDRVTQEVAEVLIAAHNDVVKQLTVPSPSVREAAEEMNTITFGRSATDAAGGDVFCPRCGGTKPTCCSCPEPAAPVEVYQLVNEFTMAAIEAHVGYQHEARWDECTYAKCVERREMIEQMRHCSPVSAAGGDEDRTRCGICNHKFRDDDEDRCDACGTLRPPRTVVERLAQHKLIGVVPGVLSGVTPLVIGTRIAVHHILGYLYNGESIEYIAENYRLTPEAVKEAIAFALEVYDDAVNAALRSDSVGEESKQEAN